MKLCYTLEGDGPLSLECYEIINKVKIAVAILMNELVCNQATTLVSSS